MNLGEYVRTFDAIYQSVRNTEIVEAPAYVFATSSGTIAPPRVGIRFVGVKVSECINKALLDDLVKIGALFV